MDDAGTPPPPPLESSPSFEVVDSNRHFMLGRDEDGYTIWRTGADDTEPIRTFPVTDQGSEEAFAAYQQLTRSARSWALTLAKWIAIVGAVAWALSGIALAAVYLGFDENGPGSFTGLVKWAQVGQSAAYPIAVGASFVYIVLWLDRRRAPTTGPRRPASAGRGSGRGAASGSRRRVRA